MSHKKKALLRCLFFHDKLRSMKSFTTEELLQSYTDHAGEAEAICDRTLRNDFTSLKSWGAPIERRKKLYYYEKPCEDLNILKGVIQAEDIEDLGHTLEILQHFKHLPPSQTMQDLLKKLKQEWGYEVKDKNDRKIIDFEEVELTNEYQLNDIYNAIRYEKVLNIKYLSFKSLIPQDLILHPYLLKEFRHRWYVVGLNQDKQSIENIAIDRIKYWNYAESEQFKHTSIPDILARYHHIIGVTIPENAPIERIVVRLQGLRARYVETKKWHHSQSKIEEKDGKTTFAFELMINPELRSRILEYSGDIEVLEPLHLRTEIADMLRQSLAFYAAE